MVMSERNVHTFRKIWSKLQNIDDYGLLPCASTHCCCCSVAVRNNGKIIGIVTMGSFRKMVLYGGCRKIIVNFLFVLYWFNNM